MKIACQSKFKACGKVLLIAATLSGLIASPVWAYDCEGFLSRAADLVKVPVTELRAKSRLADDCRRLDLDEGLGVWNPDLLRQSIGSDGRLSDFFVQHQALWRIESGRPRQLFRVQPENLLSDLTLDDQGRVWWLIQRATGPHQSQSEIWYESQGSAERFTVSPVHIDRLVFAGDHQLWGLNQAGTDDKVYAIYRFDSQGRLREFLASDQELSYAEYRPQMPRFGDQALSFEAHAKGLYDALSQPQASALAESGPLFQAIFFTRSGRPIPIPHGLSWLPDPARKQGWLLLPEAKNAQDAESQNEQPVSERGRLYLLTESGYLKSFAYLGAVALLRLDRLGQPWLLVDDTESPRGAWLNADFQLNLSPYPLYNAFGANDGISFDAASGYVLEPIEQPRPLSPDSRFETRERWIGNHGGDSYARIELRLHGGTELITQSFSDRSGLWYESHASLILYPELDLVEAYLSQIDTHPYSPGAWSRTSLLPLDFEILTRELGLEYFRILNP